MTDATLAVKYPVGTRVRLTAAVEDTLEGGTGITGTVTAWNVPEDDRGNYVRVVLDKDKMASDHHEVVEFVETVTGEPGLLFDPEELESLDE
jgi:hypothetical protein